MSSDVTPPMRIATEWFAFETVGDGVTRIWEPHVHDLMQANVWHVRGREADLLVDAGMGAGDLAGALSARELIGERPLLLVVTHAHADHAGGAHQFWPRAVHIAEASLLTTPPAWRPLVVADYPPEFHKYFDWSEWQERVGVGEAGSGEGDAEVTEGVGEEADGLAVCAVPTPGFDPWTFTVPPATPTLQVQEGDVFDLGDRALRVLHLPGHSPGSIGLWDERAGVLFAGDVVYDVGALLDGLEGSSIADYCATMRRLRDLPVQTILAGHGEPFGRDFLLRRAADYLEWRS